MAFAIKYHRLFEIRIIHSFYLRDADSFYTMTEEEQGSEFLATDYNILRDLEIVPTEACKKLLNGYRLRFKATNTGFIVGVETEPFETENTLVKPVIPIKPNTIFHFRIKIKNTNWSNVTNVRLKPSVKAAFYFNNFDRLSEKQYPSFSLKPIQHQSNRRYEMGEIVTDGSSFYLAKKGGNGSEVLTDTDFWVNITTDYRHYVNYNDRQLLSSKFSYRFIPNTDVDIDDADFDLIDVDNNVVKTISVTTPTPTAHRKLDFSEIAPDVKLVSGLYKLDVTSSSGYSDSKSVRIDNDLLDPFDWGVVAISHQDNLDNFRLLEPNGVLRIEGLEQKHPVFEIRIKNRNTFWKYILHTSDAGYAPPLTDPDFEEINGDIFTKVAQPLSNFYKEKILPPPANKKIPNPTDLLVRMDLEEDRFLSEIRLPKMNV